jgi:hypothetical protein
MALFCLPPSGIPHLEARPIRTLKTIIKNLYLTLSLPAEIILQSSLGVPIFLLDRSMLRGPS